MATPVPTGWATGRFAMHYKTVVPPKEHGSFHNLHKNMKKKLLPKDNRCDSDKTEEARKIIKQQMKIHRSQRKAADKRGRLVQRWSQLAIYGSESSRKSVTSYQMHQRRLFLPPIPNTPSKMFYHSPREVDRIVNRLSTYDVAKVPESKGYERLTPEPLYRSNTKLYSSSEVKEIVDRLSVYDLSRQPPMSRGDSPFVVRNKWKKHVVNDH